MQAGKVFQQGRVSEALDGMRLDLAAARLFPDFSRARLQGWIRQGKLTVNSRSARQRERLRSGDLLVLDAELAPGHESGPESLELEVRYQDEHLLIVNKPARLVVHPAPGHRGGTLLNGLLHQFPELAGLPRAGIVHRLDKDTSGLLLIARTLTARDELLRQIRERRIERVYQAIVQGAIVAGGTIDQPLGRHPVHRKRRAVLAEGKPARTHYRVLERFPQHTLLKISLETGRTHQIRVHMAWLGHPLTGDPGYGGRPRPPTGGDARLAAALGSFQRQALHAWRLSLPHPVDGHELTEQAPLPDDMEQLLRCLRLARNKGKEEEEEKNDADTGARTDPS